MAQRSLHTCQTQSALVLAAHQHFLTNRGIGEFIRGDTRGDDWHLLNKEGAFSLPGYYALYLMGVGYADDPFA